MASPTPFTYNATLSFPPDVGVEPCDIPIALSGYYSNNETRLLELSGAGFIDIDVSAVMPLGAKMLQIEVDADASPAAQPVQVTINGGTDTIEVSPGGFMSVGNPDPASGITSLRITHAADVTVRVRILG